MENVIKATIQVFDHLTIEITVTNGVLKFKTPKSWGGRFYASFCNYLDEAIQEQRPDIHMIIYKF